MKNAHAHRAASFVYLLLALQFTYPLWLNPVGSIEALDDPLLNSYLLDWAQYGLTHQLGDYFQATYFWPQADSFAYGEHLLAPAILAFPLRAFARSAVALHNLSLVQAYFFSALMAYTLGWRLFGGIAENERSTRFGALRRIAPAFAMGLAYGFAPYRMAQSNHLQLAHGEFLPLALLAIEGLLAAVREPEERFDPRRARVWAALLAFGAAGQWLTSWYWAVFSGVFIGLWLALRLWSARGEFPMRRLLWFAAPLALAGAAALGMAWPTIQLSRSGALFRPVEASVGMSARAVDFLRPRPRYLPASPFVNESRNPEIETEKAFAERAARRERSLFPGFGFGALALIGAGFAIRGAGPPSHIKHARAALFIALITLGLAFAPSLRFLPVVSEMRVPARWALPMWMALATLIGFAARQLLASDFAVLRGRGPTLLLTLLAVCFVESLSAPMRVVSVPEQPGPALRWLAEQPYPAPYVELPLSPLIDNRPLLRATWTRQPVMNGSNGYIPPGQLGALRKAAGFPNADAISELRNQKVRYVLIDVHASAEIQRLKSRPDLKNRTQVFDDFVVVDLEGI